MGGLLVLRKHIIHYLFIATFIIILILPGIQMVFPFIPIISVFENRAKAPMPVFRLADLVEGKYMTDYNKYFNDHFGFRDLFIKINGKIDHYILGVSDGNHVTVGKDGFLFFDETLHDYNRIATISVGESDEIAFNLKKLQTKLEKRGIRFLFFVGPNSNTIYKEKMPYPPENPSGTSNYDLLKTSLDKFKVDYQDLVPYLLKEKKNFPLYHKTDTHWNYVAGALVGDQILKHLNQSNKPDSYIRIKALHQQQRLGDLNMMRGMDTQETAVVPDVEFATGHGMLAKAIWLHDSFSFPVFPYVKPFINDLRDFNYTEATSYATISSSVKNANVLVLEITERYIPYLKEFRYSFIDDNARLAELHHLDLKPSQCRLKQQIEINENSTEFSQAITSGDDPQLEWELPSGLPAKFLSVEMQLPVGTPIQVFWANENDSGFSNAKSFSINTSPYRSEYMFDLQRIGKIKALRIDPCTQSGVNFQIKRIRFYY